MVFGLIDLDTLVIGISVAIPILMLLLVVTCLCWSKCWFYKMIHRNKNDEEAKDGELIDPAVEAKVGEELPEFPSKKKVGPTKPVEIIKFPPVDEKDKEKILGSSKTKDKEKKKEDNTSIKDDKSAIKNKYIVKNKKTTKKDDDEKETNREKTKRDRDDDKGKSRGRDRDNRDKSRRRVHDEERDRDDDKEKSRKPDRDDRDRKNRDDRRDRDRDRGRDRDRRRDDERDRTQRLDKRRDKDENDGDEEVAHTIHHGGRGMESKNKSRPSPRFPESRRSERQDGSTLDPKSEPLRPSEADNSNYSKASKRN